MITYTKAKEIGSCPNTLLTKNKEGQGERKYITINLSPCGQFKTRYLAAYLNNIILNGNL